MAAGMHIACLLIATAVPHTMPARVWEKVYLDVQKTCGLYTQNDKMEKGDAYYLNSDRWNGGDPWAQRPTECSAGFNFVDRFMEIHISKWWCEEKFKEPYLAVYDNCKGQRTDLLILVNCSTPKPLDMVIYPSGSCVFFYHYRGDIRSGYFFTLELTATKDIISFPAGGIAGLIIASLIVLMVIIKIVCIITGYERRLPGAKLDCEHRQSLSCAGRTATIVQVHTPSVEANESGGEQEENAVRDEGADNCGYATLDPAKSNSRLIRVMESAAAAEASTSGDFRDYSPPRLKRYPSAKASRIWRR